MTKKDEGFTARALLAMASEIQQAEESLQRSRQIFEALTREHGVTIPKLAAT